MRIPTHLMSAAAALALLAGPALADEQTQAQQGGDAQATTQPAQQSQDIGREPAPVPEWQVYDHLDPIYGPLAWLTFEEVLGADVLDQQGQAIGQITDLVVAQAADETYAVVQFGDAQQVAVPVDHFEVQGDEKQIVLAGDPQDVLSGMPAYEEGQYQQSRVPAEGEPPQQQQQ